MLAFVAVLRERYGYLDSGIRRKMCKRARRYGKCIVLPSFLLKGPETWDSIVVPLNQVWESSFFFRIVRFATPFLSGFLIWLPPFADDASVVGDVDLAVLIPSYLRHDIGVESV